MQYLTFMNGMNLLIILPKDKSSFGRKAWLLKAKNRSYNELYLMRNNVLVHIVKAISLTCFKHAWTTQWLTLKPKMY